MLKAPSLSGAGLGGRADHVPAQLRCGPGRTRQGRPPLRAEEMNDLTRLDRELALVLGAAYEGCVVDLRMMGSASRLGVIHIDRAPRGLTCGPREAL